MKSARGIESELKYGLTREEYVTLLRGHRGREIRVQNQINYYFDDIHLNLRKRRIGLRIRLVNSRSALLTLKYPKPSGRVKIRALKVRAEFESRISAQAARRVLSGKLDILSLDAMPIRKLGRVFPLDRLCRLRPLGSIETRRHVLPLNRKFIMELDRSRMFGKFFYELEVETQRPAKADKAVHNLFWKFDIGYQPLRRSKLARFIEEWRRRQA